MLARRVRVAFRSNGKALVRVLGRAGKGFLFAADVVSGGVEFGMAGFEERVEAGIVRL